MPVTNVKSEWSSGNLIFKRALATTAASVQFGVDDNGIDVVMYGDTSGANCTWDSSADSLILTGATLDSAAFSVGGTAGVDFTSGAITNLEIINGIVVYAS